MPGRVQWGLPLGALQANVFTGLVFFIMVLLL
jgi:hypothetical protein